MRPEGGTMTKSYLGRNTSSVQVRNPMKNFWAIVLAAGEGVRRGAEHSKLLHPVMSLREMVGPCTCIVDEIEATPRERQTTEVNTGCYCIARPLLFGALREIARSPGREEVSLRQLVEVFTKWGMPVHVVAVADPIEVMGINTPAELAQATAILR